MLKLGRKTALALEAVLDVAYNARPDPVQARDITARQGIPHRYLEQVLQRLVREGLLRGVRGPRGGYTLARERRRVTLGDVVRIVAAMDAEEEGLQLGPQLGARVIAPIWDAAEADVLRRFDAVTLEDLCRAAREQGIPLPDGTLPDFAI
jgi:Rrf2 family iron-sulfur cluster assembly transcriptional regulator